MNIRVDRKAVRFEPDSSRIIARFFSPGGPDEVGRIIRAVTSMSASTTKQTLSAVLRGYANRHRNVSQIFENNCAAVSSSIESLGMSIEELQHETRMLIGAYFTKEYSLESAALFNPSIVEDPDQSDVDSESKRMIVSFRATGEGHISSLVFRRIILDEHAEPTAIPPGRYSDQAERVKRYVYDKAVFVEKLKEMRIEKDIVAEIMDRLGATFIYGELRASIDTTLAEKEISYSRRKVVESMLWLADSHYEITFSMDTALSERVIFPISYTETNGIEDARFVRFTGDDGTYHYCATYTAYNGYATLPKLITTTDFYHFEVKPLHGEGARNKGMALFPRKVNGRYAMLSRLDGTNNYVMYSDSINVWHEAHRIYEPRYPWEVVKVGNAGSPIETEHGWLVITHGIGPMRQYSLGAMLLDIDDPTKVIASLPEPLIAPNESERDGYVPNVVYSCGSCIHNGSLVIPYAISDQKSTIATVDLADLFEALKNHRHG